MINTDFRNWTEKEKQDKATVLQTVKLDGWALAHASEQLQDDKEIVLEAVKNKGYAINHASERLQKDEEIIREAKQEIELLIRIRKE